MPIAQSILAMQLGWMFAALVCGVIWMLHRLPEEGVVALSFGMYESIVALLPVAIVGGLIHVGLGRATRGRGTVAINRGLILGAIGGLCGALSSGAVPGVGRIWR
jgi:hypothetical protein